MEICRTVILTGKNAQQIRPTNAAGRTEIFGLGIA